MAKKKVTDPAKHEAIERLTKLYQEINEIAKGDPFSSAHTRWVSNVWRALEAIFGRRSRYFQMFSRYDWSFKGATVIMSYELVGRHPEDAMRGRHKYAFLTQLESAHGLLASAVDELSEAKSLADVYDGKDTVPGASSILKVINVIERKLRRVIHEKPEREKQVQDAMESLLVGADVPFSRERDSFQYSTRSYRPDFVLKEIDLVIELKICTSADKEREIIREINDDILAYKTKYANILFVIYDLGCIRDVETFGGQFEKYDNVVVRVIKH